MDPRNVGVRKVIRDQIIGMRELRKNIGGISNNITQSAWRSRLWCLRRSWSCLGCLIFGSIFLGFPPLLDAFTIRMASC